MNNNVSENQKKDRIMKSLAVGGFVGFIIIIAWLGIKVVSFMPNALGSLASLAESVYHYKPVEIVTVSDKNTITSGEAVTLSWNTPSQKGTFSFSYACTDGVSVDLRTATGIISANCDTQYNVGAVSTVDIIAFSEKSRFADLRYTIAFIPTRSTEPTAAKESGIAVTNPAIGIAGLPETPVTPTTPEPEPTPTTPAPTPAPATTTPATPKPTTPPKPVYIEEYVYEIPVSNPNGKTDLTTTFVSFGTLDAAGRYTKTTAIDNDSKGAVQFEVKNVGTKTSTTWTFSAVLPNGELYISEKQTALKPNERALLTLGFAMPNNTGTKSLTVSATTESDTNKANNSFSVRIPVTE